jgi:hypothetical protein
MIPPRKTTLSMIPKKIPTKLKKKGNREIHAMINRNIGRNSDFCIPVRRYASR